MTARYPLAPPWLSTADAAALLLVAPATLRRWAASGAVPARRHKDAWWFHRDHLLSWLADQPVA